MTLQFPSFCKKWFKSIFSSKELVNMTVRLQGDVIKHETAEFYLDVKLQSGGSEITQLRIFIH